MYSCKKCGALFEPKWWELLCPRVRLCCRSCAEDADSLMSVNINSWWDPIIVIAPMFILVLISCLVAESYPVDRISYGLLILVVPCMIGTLLLLVWVRRRRLNGLARDLVGADGVVPVPVPPKNSTGTKNDGSEAE